jgi:hypothetical protein
VSLTPAGGACDLSSECEDGLYCPQFPDAGQCSEMKPVGGPCRPDWAQVLGMARDCLSGVCQGTGQLGTCAAEGVPACP